MIFLYTCLLWARSPFQPLNRQQVNRIGRIVCPPIHPDLSRVSRPSYCHIGRYPAQLLAHGPYGHPPYAFRFTLFHLYRSSPFMGVVSGRGTGWKNPERFFTLSPQHSSELVQNVLSIAKVWILALYVPQDLHWRCHLSHLSPNFLNFPFSFFPTVHVFFTDQD